MIGDIPTLNGGPLNLVDKFTYLESSVSLTENDINTWLAKAWTTIDTLSVIWKSVLLHRWPMLTLTKRMKKKPDGNYTWMLRTVLKKSWRQHLTKEQLYGYLPPITKTIQIRQTRHAGNCWRSTGELISDVLRWTPSYRRSKVGRPARTYQQQLCTDTGCSLEDMPGAMNDITGGKRGSGKSVLAARRAVDDDDINFHLVDTYIDRFVVSF